jgi:hypothetical protein
VLQWRSERLKDPVFHHAVSKQLQAGNAAEDTTTQIFPVKGKTVLNDAIMFCNEKNKTEKKKKKCLVIPLRWVGPGPIWIRWRRK